MFDEEGGLPQSNNSQCGRAVTAARKINEFRFFVPAAWRGTVPPPSTHTKSPYLDIRYDVHLRSHSSPPKSLHATWCILRSLITDSKDSALASPVQRRRVLNPIRNQIQFSGFEGTKSDKVAREHILVTEVMCSLASPG
ncbi:hypothetical protein TWF225_006820 [Orbilia oligospora]|nr:hypothetical protein TWF225_006820 [Orbilia oligospora]